MAKLKPTKKYYFTVEGETEQWYLQWLQKQINDSEASQYKVSLDCPVQKNPLKRAKSLVVTGKTEIYHFMDYESDEPIHVSQFTEAMDNMKKAQQLGKQIRYHFGYTNLTFDLWIILHKADSNSSLTHRRQHLTPLNRAFEEHFESMDEYKHEANFKRILSRLILPEVVEAINRAKAIMQRNHEIGYILHQYKGYHYYKENPSLAVWEPIERILKDCRLM